MKAVGIVRKVDHLGRISIPKATREFLGIEIGDPVHYLVGDDGLIAIEKYRPTEKENAS